jgi:hypothetical protein
LAIRRAIYLVIAIASGAIAGAGFQYWPPFASIAARADWTPTLGPEPAPNSFRITASHWRLTADGTWTSVIRGRFASAGGKDLPLVHAKVTWRASRGQTLDLVRWPYMDPATLVTLTTSRRVTVTATPTDPANRTAALSLAAPPNNVASFAAVARAVGPHLVNVGWTPLAIARTVTSYNIYRRDVETGTPEFIASVSSNANAYHDDGALPGRRCRYTVEAMLGRNGWLTARSNAVDVPEAMPPTSDDAITGKGMFLLFNPDASDPDYGYPSYDVDGVVAHAKAAGVRNIELRMAYGSFFEAFTPAAQAWLDRFIDAADSAGISLLAWQVPRRATTDDIAEAVAVARYRTPAGNGFAGAALDIENGDDFMGDGTTAKQGMVDYIHEVRQAVGPDYLVVATIISPKLTRWTNAQYPYARIAAYASVLQPMEYWHHYFEGSHHVYGHDGVAGAVSGAVELSRRLAGRDLPINVGGQSDDLGGTGAPSPDEITWSLSAAKRAGAIGEMFFDWRGTPADRWTAIGAFPW